MVRALQKEGEFRYRQAGDNEGHSAKLIVSEIRDRESVTTKLGQLVTGLEILYMCIQQC